MTSLSSPSSIIQQKLEALKDLRASLIPLENAAQQEWISLAAAGRSGYALRLHRREERKAHGFTQAEISARGSIPRDEEIHQARAERSKKINRIKEKERQLSAEIYQQATDELSEHVRLLSTYIENEFVRTLKNAVLFAMLQIQKIEAAPIWYTQNECMEVLARTIELINEPLNSPGYEDKYKNYLIFAEEMGNKPTLKTNIIGIALLVIGVAFVISMAMLVPYFGIGLSITIGLFSVAALATAATTSYLLLQKAALPRNLTYSMTELAEADKNYKNSISFFGPTPSPSTEPVLQFQLQPL